MRPQFLRKLGCTAGRSHTIRCSFLFTGTSDVFPPLLAASVLKYSGGVLPYRWSRSYDQAMPDCCKCPGGVRYDAHRERGALGEGVRA